MYIHIHCLVIISDIDIVNIGQREGSNMQRFGSKTRSDQLSPTTPIPWGPILGAYISLSLSLSICIYIYIYIHTCTCTCV